MRKILIAGIALCALYSGLWLVGALQSDAIELNDIVALSGGAALSLLFACVYIVYPHPVFFPLFMGSSILVAFIVLGLYMQECDFYYFIMLLVVCFLSRLKKFKLLAIYVVINICACLFMLVFLIPQLFWLESTRFFAQFLLFLYGSVFIILQTRDTELKENRATQAFMAFSSLLNNTPNYMLITDASTRVRYISNPMLKFAHFVRREFAEDQPIIDLFHDKTLKLMFADILDAEGLYDTVIKINIEGRERHLRIVSNKLAGTHGDRFIDITDVTQIEENRLAAEEARYNAELANSSKSKFLATMSHEIRTPMNAIIGIAQIQLQKENLQDEYAVALEKIYNSGESLLGIINDILDMSKIETGKLDLNSAEYDLPSLINDTVQLNAVRIGSKPIEFVLGVDETLPLRLYGDELRLKQVLNNLLSNAIKYTKQGQVKLSVTHSTENEDVMLSFVIEDTGQGMKPEDLARLFSEYLRFNAEANRTTEGTGLGLSIVKRLVEMMEGEIHVESEYGRGSVFTVTIKQQAVASAPIGGELAKQLCNFTFRSSGRRGGLQITYTSMPYGSVLIVDDTETNLYVAEGLLAPYKLKIETANSGFAALDKVKSGRTYDVLFMDHMMPEMDGIETTEKLRAFGYTGVIVALTANALAGNDKMFAENGFDGFISKPINIFRLNEVVNKFIRDRYPEEAKKYTPEALVENTTGAANPEMRRVFCLDAAKASIALRETAAGGDMRLFTVTAHSMKSALANIGERETSALAAALEKAGRDGDADFIAANTEGFIERLEALTRDFRPADANGEEDASISEDTAFLAEQLRLLQAACEDFNDDAAYAALDRLREKRWKRETDAALQGIRDMLFLHSDFDGAAEQARLLAEK